MKYLLCSTAAIFLIILSGCNNQSYYTTDGYPTSAYPYSYSKTDITLFDSGLTNYREQHGFDVFRENGSFYNGRFYH
jgi:hypothetical protein